MGDKKYLINKYILYFLNKLFLITKIQFKIMNNN